MTDRLAGKVALVIVDGGCMAGLGHEDFSAVAVDQQTDWVT
jgi:3alpha(or 20beta)-hydroxysteroid dehydrogenase